MSPSTRSWTTTVDIADRITPTEIEHSVDDYDTGDQRGQRYNYLDYHFERDGAYLRARVYLAKTNLAIVFGPFNGRSNCEPVTAFELLDDAMNYLQRRYRKVTRR